MITSPYIGITDFTSFDQVKAMLAVFRKHAPKRSKRVLHVGVMMSYKTLNGIETKWSKAFPPKEGVADIFHHTKQKVYYCLHYADYGYDSIFKDLVKALELAGPFVNALQLDMPWPDPLMISNAIHASRKHIEVILQVGKKSMEECNDDPREVVHRLRDYEGIIHRVLLDKSMGKGLGMNAEVLIPFAKAIREKFPAIGIVAAGGLGPDTMELVAPFVKEFPDISIDAQGKLRPSGDSLDPIDWDMAEAYLIEALKMLG